MNSGVPAQDGTPGLNRARGQPYRTLFTAPGVPPAIMLTAQADGWLLSVEGS